MPRSGRVFYLRVRLSLAFTSSSPQSLDSGRRPLHLRGFLLERRSSRVPRWPVGAPLSPRVAGTLQGHAGCPGLAVPLFMGLVGPRGGAVFGLQSRMQWLEADRSSIARVSVFALARCSPLAAVWVATPAAER